MTIAIIAAASILAYFLIGVLTFCWGIRNVLINYALPELLPKFNDDPSYWFGRLDDGDILICSVMGVFWPITFLCVAISNLTGWLWTHLLVKIITKGVEHKLRKEKKTDK